MEVLSRQPLVNVAVAINRILFRRCLRILRSDPEIRIFTLPLEIEEPENPSVTDLMRADEWLRLFEVMSETQIQ